MPVAVGYQPIELKVVVLFGHTRMISYALFCSKTNDACTPRTSSAPPCSREPETNAPATSAPTTTRATIAIASAIPRSFFRICFMDHSLMFTSNALPSAYREGRRAGSAARIVAQRDPGRDAIDLVRQRSLGAAGAHRLGRLGPQVDFDQRHLARVRRHHAGRVEVIQLHAGAAVQRADERLDRGGAPADRPRDVLTAVQPLRRHLHHEARRPVGAYGGVCGLHLGGEPHVVGAAHGVPL